MLSIVVAQNREVFQVFEEMEKGQNAFQFYFQADELFAVANKSQVDFLFIDIEILKKLQVNKNLGGPLIFERPLSSLLKIFPSARIIVMCSSELSQEAIHAIKGGAHHFLSYPLNSDEIYYVKEELTQKDLVKSELNYLQKSLWDDASIFFHSTNSKVQDVYQLIKLVAPTNSTVLLTGESGTGKSLMAKKIHDLSQRRDESFVSVHCGSLSENLIESELFGHEKGAFTGAHRRKLGKFELAHKGTIFLDEIGTISSQAQVKLLRVLQERAFERVGGENDIKVDVRIIAATNIDFKKLIQNKEFREDLYYRLNVFPIELPSLRERKEDIPGLVKVFLEKLNRDYIKEIEEVEEAVWEAFFNYSWPGNIRELENIVERAFILEKSHKLGLESIPQSLTKTIPTAPVPLINEDTVGELLSLSEVRKYAIESIERNYLKELLTRTGGKINKSSEIAGVTTRQLHKLLNKYDLKRSDFTSQK